jgi:hypothetical protein
MKVSDAVTSATEWAVVGDGIETIWFMTFSFDQPGWRAGQQIPVLETWARRSASATEFGSDRLE